MWNKPKTKNLMEELKHMNPHDVLLTVCLCLLTAVFTSCRSESEHLVNYNEDDANRIKVSNLYPAIGEQIKVETLNKQNVTGTVDFGDGTGTVPFGNALHTYEAAGTYVITA